MKDFIIHPKHLPTKLPVTGTIVMWLLVKELPIPEQWLGIFIGVVSTLVGIYWMVVLYAVITQKFTKLQISIERYIKSEPQE